VKIGPPEMIGCFHAKGHPNGVTSLSGHGILWSIVISIGLCARAPQL
jgi:hypothetical protein